MNIVVLGCGAIGGTVAAHLTRAGLRVTAITGNAAIARAIVENGYRLRELDGGEWSVPATATPLVSLADADAPATFDLCIAATQSTRLAGALEAVLPRLAPAAPVVCLQNGLPEERAAAIVGADRVVGCVVGWGASMLEPGLYVRTSRGGFTIGRVGGGGVGAPRGEHGTGRLDAVGEVLVRAAPVIVADDLAGVRWSKLAINCCTTTIGAIGGGPLGSLLRRRFVRRIALEVFAEVNAVARAAGVRVAPVGGTLDIGRVAITAAERRQRFGSPSLAIKHSVLLAVGVRFRRLRSSMLYALERGRPPEIDYLNAEVVRRGEALGVPTPVNRALVAEVRALFAGERRPGLEALRAIFDRVVVPGPAAEADRDRSAAEA
jgi:2-dehydropantoate 2-reductase